MLIISRLYLVHAKRFGEIRVALKLTYRHGFYLSIVEATTEERLVYTGRSTCDAVNPRHLRSFHG
jgi:hypothetical protein